jgi:hypothetical protein
MEHIAQKLRKAYTLLRDANANTTDIEGYYLTVDEALGYVAESLDLVESIPTELMPQTFEDDGNTKFFIDEEEVSCEKFNDFFNAHDTGWSEGTDEYGTLRLTIFRDDAR